MRRLNKLHAGLAVCILLFLCLGYVIIKPSAEDQQPYLSFSADLDGVKAWREMLESKPYRVKEWRLAWKDLPGGAHQGLVAVQPSGVSKEDVQNILTWVEQGNDLIIFDQHPFEWKDYFPIEAVVHGDGVDPNSGQSTNASRSMDSESSTHASTNKSAYTVPNKSLTADVKQSADEQAHSIFREGDGLQTWAGVVETEFRLTRSAKQQVLLSDSQGVLASRTAIGLGQVTMVLTPEWLTNESVLKHSHFELAWPLFAEPWSTVWLDETHHGYATKRGLSAIYPAWLKLAAVQLSLALLAWLWLLGKRFGPVYTLRAWTVRRGDETLLAVAGWYERLGFRSEALAHQQLHLRQLLFERWGVSPGATAQQAAEAARARWPEAQAARLGRLLEAPALPGGAAGGNPLAQRGQATAKQFVERTREMGEMIAYLEKE